MRWSITLVLAAAAAGCGGNESGGGSESAAGGAPGGAGVVNVYSHRHYDVDRQLFEQFTAETGIQVNVVTGSADELITRLESEGSRSPADVLITVDAGRLHRATERDLLQPIESPVLESNVPAQYRDPQGRWFGLTRRARVLVYSRDRVDSTRLSTYEALADAEWRGRVLSRSSENVYNQSLLASIIAASGEEAAREWAAGVARNFARSPTGGDTDQAKAVAAGTGDVAIVNTYYVARLGQSEDAEERRVFERLGVFFPNQADRGTHVNVSGAGVTRYAPNRQNAVRLIEYLSGDEAQRLFAEGNQEYPVKPGIPASETLRSWGEFRADELELSRLGELNSQAVMMFDRSGWN